MSDEAAQTIVPPTALKEGQEDESLGKKIYFLIRRNRDYVVYLDEDYCIEWWTMALRLPLPHPPISKSPEQLELEKRGAEVRARCLSWEGVLDTMDGGPDLKDNVKERQMFLPYRRQLAEIVAETLGSGGPDVAQKLLTEVEGRIRSVAAMRARMWLLNTAFIGAIVLAVALVGDLAGLLLVNGDHRTEQLLIIAACCIMGGFGAVLSMLIRSSQLEIDFAAGAYVHQKEAIARLLTGVFAGLVTYLLLKSGLFFAHLVNGAADSTQIAILLLLATVSGTSERLVKSFLSKVEEKASDAAKA